MKIKNPFRTLGVQEGDAIITRHAQRQNLHHALEAKRLRYEAAQMLALAVAHEHQANIYLQEAEKHRNKASDIR